MGEDILKQIDELYQKITPDDESDDSVDEQITAASQHLAEFFTASSKEFVGTTCILLSIFIHLQCLVRYIMQVRIYVSRNACTKYTLLGPLYFLPKNVFSKDCPFRGYFSLRRDLSTHSISIISVAFTNRAIATLCIFFKKIMGRLFDLSVEKGEENAWHEGKKTFETIEHACHKFKVSSFFTWQL